MLGVLAELERAMIVERVRAGLRQTVAWGKKLSRPRVVEKMEQAVLGPEVNQGGRKEYLALKSSCLGPLAGVPSVALSCSRSRLCAERRSGRTAVTWWPTRTERSRSALESRVPEARRSMRARTTENASPGPFLYPEKP